MTSRHMTSDDILRVCMTASGQSTVNRAVHSCRHMAGRAHEPASQPSLPLKPSYGPTEGPLFEILARVLSGIWKRGRRLMA